MDELELNSPLHTPRLPYRPFGFLPGSTLLHASRKLLLCTKHFWGAVRFDDDCGLEASRRPHRPMLLFPRLSLGMRAAGMPPQHLVSGRLRQQRPLRSEPIAGKSTAAVRSAAVSIVSAMHVLGYPCALPSRDRAIVIIVIKTRLI